MFSALDDIEFCFYRGPGIFIPLIWILYRAYLTCSALRLLPFGLAMAGPPCSLMVNACQSVHRRRAWRLEGDTGNFKVRMSNRIWKTLWLGFYMFYFTLCTRNKQGIRFTIIHASFVFFCWPYSTEYQWRACNQAMVLKSIIHRGVFICIEQPVQSWALKQEYFHELIRIGNMCLDKVIAFYFIFYSLKT